MFLVSVFAIKLHNRDFRDFMQLTGQKHRNGPIITLTCLIGKLQCLSSTSIACFAPNSGKGNVKEPKYLNVYQIISRTGNVGMEGDFLINILVVDF